MFCRHYMVRATPTVLDTATLAEAMAIMIKHHRQQLLVINASNEYVGEITTFTLAKLLLADTGDRPPTAEEAERETVVDVDDRSLIMEITGAEDKITKVCDVLRPFGILSMVRTGVVAMRRGSDVTSEEPPLVPARIVTSAVDQSASDAVMSV